jgi:hypothetical protein
VLEQALARKGGMVNYLETTYPDATIDLSKKSSLTLPGYVQPFHVQPGS